MKRKDVYSNVISSITDSLSDGVKPWQACWERDIPIAWPTNALTGKEYQGINASLLLMAQIDNRLCSHQWLTHGQSLEWLESQSKERDLNLVKIRKSGGKGFYFTTDNGGYVGIRKGALRMRCVKWVPPVKGKPVDRAEANGEDVIVRRGFTKTFTLCNVDQIEGIKEAYIPIDMDYQHVCSVIDTYVMLNDLKIVYEGAQPSFSPKEQIIRMPERSLFNSEGSYFVTFLHELVHATKLKHERTPKGYTPSQASAFEELCAEIGAVFLCAKLGIVGEPIDNHASYIDGWLSLLKDDPEAFAHASKYAQQAAESILGVTES